MSQLPSLTGIDVPRSNSFILDTWHLLVRFESVHLMSAAAGLLAMGLLLGFKRFAPRLPGGLIMMTILTGLSYATDFSQHGGHVVGSIPAGMPSFSIPLMGLDATMALLPAAFVIALVSFMEAMSSCKVIAGKTRTRWDENQELIGQGLAKIAAAFCNSMPVSGSFSRSALNLASNARTGFSSLFAAGFVWLTLVFFTPWLYHLPKPALAAMIFMSVFNLIDFSSLRNAWLANRDDGIAAALTFLATLAFAPSIQNGILCGILFSLGAFIYRRMAPHIVLEGGAEKYQSTDANIDKVPQLPRGIAVMRFHAALFFANAGYFDRTVRRIEIESPKLKFILVDAHGINSIDSSAIEMLRSLLMHLRDIGVVMAFCGSKQRVVDVMERTGLMQEIGAQNFFDSEPLALADLAARDGERHPISKAAT